MTSEMPKRAPHHGQPPWLKALFRAFFRIAFGKCRIRGIAQIPPEGPLIIASTHRSYIDPIVLGAFIPRPITFMAKSELFENRALAALIRFFGAFPLDRERARGSTFRTAENLLRRGEAVVIFPEGGIVDSLGEQGFKGGVGLLGALTGAPIVPIYLEETNTLFSWPGGLTGRTRMALRAGEPITAAGKKGREGRNHIAERVTEALRELARGETARAEPPD